MAEGPVTLDIVRLLKAVDDVMGKHIEWATDDGRIRTGTVRGFRAEKDLDGYVRIGQDLRDTWVRITTSDTGWELWMPTMELVEKLQKGYARETA